MNVEDLYSGEFKTLEKEIEENWKMEMTLPHPFWWVRKIKVVKWIPKVIFTLNVTATNIPGALFTETERPP